MVLFGVQTPWNITYLASGICAPSRNGEILIILGSAKPCEDPSNAAPEWQERIQYRSQVLLEACPLEGLVRDVTFWPVDEEDGDRKLLHSDQLHITRAC
jgi:hypothetical protein